MTLVLKIKCHMAKLQFIKHATFELIGYHYKMGIQKETKLVKLLQLDFYCV